MIGTTRTEAAYLWRWLLAAGGSFIRFASRNGRLRVGLIIAAFWVLVAALAPFVAPYSPTEPHPYAVLAPPSMRFFLGTDLDGIDILSRILWAPRTDLGVALLTTTLSFSLGVPVGAFAGYFAGRSGALGVTSNLTMRIVDVSLAVPLFVLALAVVAVLGRSSINLVLAMTVANTPIFIWLTRSSVLGVREKPFVEAARCSGNTELGIAFRHVLPNSLTAVLTQLSIIMGASVLLTAGLSFVGAGVRIPTPEWGLMVAEGAPTMISGAWWPALFPGLALATAVFGFSLIGDGLRQYLDPKQRRESEAPLAVAVSAMEALPVEVPS